MKREEWDRRYADTELLWSAGPNRFVTEAAAGLEPGRAIDLACGEGRNAIWLAEQGWNVRAVDFSEVAIDRGRRIAEQRGVDVDWRVEDLTEYVPDAGAYDLVVIAYLHLPAEMLAPILERAAAATAPGGTFFLIGHDRRNLAEGYGGPPSERVLYGPPDVTPHLGGLEIARAETVERQVETDGGPRTALDVLVRAVRPA